MGQIPRSVRLFEKAEAALLAAIEIYNKPDFKYREETFTILALNAWELLLKAKLLAASGNDPRCLYVYEKRQTKAGKLSKRRYRRRNRAGNDHTIGLGQVIPELSKRGIKLHAAVRSNLDALTEIRDNAVHYMNASPSLARRVLEIGTASLKNFIELAKQWFNQDLSKYNLYLMPIGFVQGPGIATAIAANENRLLAYLSGIVREASADDPNFHVALTLNLSFKRAAPETIGTVAVATDPLDPGATKIVITEEAIRKQYPWDYRELTRRLRERYVDFKTNEKFHEIKRPLLKDQRYVRRRYLDQDNPRSPKKDYFNPNIVTEFDKHYTQQ